MTQNTQSGNENADTTQNTQSGNENADKLTPNDKIYKQMHRLLCASWERRVE